MLPCVKKDDAAHGNPEVEWHQIACGANCTVAITPTGELFTWGKYFALGHGNLEQVDQPKQVASLIGKKVAHVSCGHHHTVVVTSEGDLYTWYVLKRYHIDF
jgi:alpha-tubulin suppressor-like RCC1 family protein